MNQTKCCDKCIYHGGKWVATGIAGCCKSNCPCHQTEEEKLKDWEELSGKVIDIIFNREAGFSEKLELICQKYLHQAKQESYEQGRQEGVRSVVEIFDNYFPYAMGCHSCREITLRELETLKEAIKKELL